MCPSLAPLKQYITVGMVIFDVHSYQYNECPVSRCHIKTLMKNFGMFGMSNGFLIPTLEIVSHSACCWRVRGGVPSQLWLGWVFREAGRAGGSRAGCTCHNCRQCEQLIHSCTGVETTEHSDGDTDGRGQGDPHHHSHPPQPGQHCQHQVLWVGLFVVFSSFHLSSALLTRENE